MIRRKYKKYTQIDFGNTLNIDQGRVSRLLNGTEKVSFPLAVELSKLFPSKGILGWKNATKEEINCLYEQLKREAA